MNELFRCLDRKRQHRMKIFAVERCLLFYESVMCTDFYRTFDILLVVYLKNDIERRNSNYQHIVIIIFNRRKVPLPCRFLLERNKSVCLIIQMLSSVNNTLSNQSACYSCRSHLDDYARLCMCLKIIDIAFSNKDALHTLALRMYTDKRREKKTR
jgi:hypothetical protein